MAVPSVLSVRSGCPCPSLFAQAYHLLANNPRRVLHSAKVGLALALVSLTILQQDLYQRLGSNAIWAVMTVVVVFELTVGATLGKGSNRALGTLLAGGLALGVEYLADMAGPSAEAYVIGVSVFLVGSIATFVRFCEPFKSKYDYGVLIFLLTFALIIVSGYRVTDNLDMAISRLLTIVLGGAVCLIINMLVWPIWAGEDLHNIICGNLDSLGGALEDCAQSYFKQTRSEEQVDDQDSMHDRYKKIFQSKPSEESLAIFASWEPRCRIFAKKRAWKQYVKVGGMLRRCTQTVASLNSCFRSDVQAPISLRKAFSNPCLRIALESASLLKDLAAGIRRREKSRPKEELMRSVLARVEKLKKDINAYPHLFVNLQQWALQPVESPFGMISGSEPHISVGGQAEQHAGFQSTEADNKVDSDSGKKSGVPFTEFLSIATVAFLLIELVPRLEHLVDAVKTLEELAGFRTSKFRRPFVAVMDHSCYDSMAIQMAE